MRRTLPLFKWASPRSLRLLRVKVPKSNSVVAVANTKKQSKNREEEEEEEEMDIMRKIV